MFIKVYGTLTESYKTFYRQYKNQEYNLNVNNQIEIEKEEEKSKYPQNFDDLLKCKGGMSLFSTFVQEHFGQNYIECYHELLKYYSNEDEIKETKIFFQYLKTNSSKNIIKNIDFRNDIIIKDKLQKDWDIKLFKFIYQILKSEFYTRFINSITWKNYIKINDEKDEKDEKISDFEDLYQVQNIIKSMDSFSETIEILIVKNKKTSEQFRAIKIISSKKNIEERRIQALNQINHDNIIQLIDLFHEDLESFNKSCLTLVTTDLNESLDKYLNHINEPFFKLELIDLMIQLLTALQQFHKLKRFFDIGELTERTIYFSGLYSNLYIDPGFFQDDFDYLNYFEPPEKFASMKSDIFAMGLIFFRMSSILSSKKVEDVMKRKVTDNRILSMIRDSLIQPDYFYNIRHFLTEQKSELGNEMIDLILSMIDSRPDHRKDVDVLLEDLGKMRSNLNKFSMIRRRKKTNKFEKLEKAQIKILESEDLRDYFKAYLRTEYAIEPLLFYEDVQIFQQLPLDQERFFKAQEICQTYLRSTSDLEINVSGKLKKLLSEELKRSKDTDVVGIEIFDEMVKHICDTLLIDTFPRFHLSKIYIELQEHLKEK